MSSVLESSPLNTVTVSDVMSPGVLTSPPTATLAAVAATMVVHQVHCVVLAGTMRGVSALDAVAAAVADPGAQTADIARELPVAERSDTLLDAARMMVSHGESHVLVAAPDSEGATGVISSVDIAAALAHRPVRLVRQVRPGPARPAISTSRLDRVRVAAVMHHGVVSCAPATSLEEIASALVAHHVHCLAVGADASTVVSDMDVVAAAAAARPAVDEHAGERLPWIGPDDTLRHAAELMSETGARHLVVRDSADGAAGIVSTLDVLGVVAIGAQ